jgi:hypothetical protein
MSASSCSLDGPDRVLLRWSEDASSPSREELVEMVETRISEAVICSALRVLEHTKVFLIGKDSTESGVVRSCRPFGGKYIVTILINSQNPNPPDVDPGVLLVDTFMTEDQEQAILDEIDKEIGTEQFRSLDAAKACLNATWLEGTAAWNRLRKFTVRSSTALVSGSLVQFWSRCRQAAGTCPLNGTPAGVRPIAASGTVEPPSIPSHLSSSIQ